MRTLVFAIALSAALPAVAAFKSGNDLAEYCNDQESKFFEGVCAGYVIGVVDALAGSTKAWCAPSGVTTRQLIAIVRKYMAENPAQLHISADLLVRAALLQAYPCK